MGYRVSAGPVSVTYIPDHEPVLGGPSFPSEPEWISGWELARGADLLIHDAQYTAAEYENRVGWGHSAISDTLAFGEAAGVARLVLFHHDPAHSDEVLDAMMRDARTSAPAMDLIPAREGESFDLDPEAPARA